jgi:hypothetical protein
MSQAFVGTRSASSGEELEQVLLGFPAQSRCYFLRWVHKISGFVEELPKNFPSPEGEMLTPEFEVRWKPARHGYELLLLHSGQPAESWGFTPIEGDWVASEPLRTHLHAKGELQGPAEARQDTRFPNPFIYPSGLELQQRYFQKTHTGTIHFVGLTAKLKEKAS